MTNGSRDSHPRVVVTGMGIVSHLGCSVPRVVDLVLSGTSKFSRFRGDMFAAFPQSTVVVGSVHPMERFAPYKEHTEPDQDIDNRYTPEDFTQKSELRSFSMFVTYGLIASQKALKSAGWEPKDQDQRLRSGVFLGTGVAGAADLEADFKVFATGEGAARPLTFIMAAPNSLPAVVGIRNRFLGPALANSDACATGTIAIANAYRAIVRGDIDVAVAGASEAPISETSLSSFRRIHVTALGFEDSPQHASRPFDRDRKGLVLSEGAAAVVLERLDHALQRGATIYGEVLGFGVASDSFHITQPDPSGEGQVRAMGRALASANLTPDDIDYVNCHATSTTLGDPLEIASVEKAFGSRARVIPMSSLKGILGHSLAACGALETVIALASLNKGFIPPNANLDNPDEKLQGFDLVGKTARRAKVRVFMKNSFGFGGINASIIFKIPSGERYNLDL